MKIILSVSLALILGCARAPLVNMKITDEEMIYSREGNLSHFDSLQIERNAQVLREERRAKIFKDTILARARAKAIGAEGGSDYCGDYYGRILNKSNKLVVVTHNQGKKVYKLGPYKTSPEIGLAPQPTKFWARFYEAESNRFLGQCQLELTYEQIISRNDNYFDGVALDWLVWFEWKD